MQLSIVIPAYNEARRLPPTLGDIVSYLSVAAIEAEIIVVDDGSTDGTSEAVRSMTPRTVALRLIRHAHNHGKGAAVRDGILASRGDYVLFMDADQSTPIGELERLLAVARDGVPVVIGSRHLDPRSITVRQPGYRRAISRLGNLLIRHAVLPEIRDTQCGFKLLRRDAARELARRLTMEGFSFDIEMLVNARLLGYEVAELPVSWHDTPGTRVRPIRASLQTLRDVLLIRRASAGTALDDQPPVRVHP